MVKRKLHQHLQDLDQLVSSRIMLEKVDLVQERKKLDL